MANQYTKTDRPAEADIEAASDRLRRLVAEINELRRGYYFLRFLAGNAEHADLNAMNNAATYLGRALEVMKGRATNGN